MKNRIMFISRTLTDGGAERFIATFASYLAERREVYLLLYERKEGEYPLSNKVKVLKMPQESGKIDRITSMRKIIKQFKPDIIVPFIDTVVLCAFLAQIGLNNSFVYTVRNSPWEERENRITKIFKKLMISHANYIMLQNEEQREYFKSKYRDKEVIVPNPVSLKFIDSPKSHYTNQIKHIVFVGRLEAQKNIPLLLEAFSDVRKEFPQIDLKLYGAGSQREQIEEKVFKLGIDDSCCICGRSNNIEKELQQADLFVLTSNYEGMPNSLIEAMTVGVPCISSDCRTGPKSLINSGKSGLLFKTGDKESLKKELIWALKHPLEMADLGRSGRNFILENFVIDKIESRFSKILE